MSTALRAMDYTAADIITIQIDRGGPDGWRILNGNGRQLTGVSELVITLDNVAGIYEATFVHNGKRRNATIIGT